MFIFRGGDISYYSCKFTGLSLKSICTKFMNLIHNSHYGFPNTIIFWLHYRQLHELLISWNNLMDLVDHILIDFHLKIGIHRFVCKFFRMWIFAHKFHKCSQPMLFYYDESIHTTASVCECANHPNIRNMLRENSDGVWWYNYTSAFFSSLFPANPSEHVVPVDSCLSDVRMWNSHAKILRYAPMDSYL